MGEAFRPAVWLAVILAVSAAAGLVIPTLAVPAVVAALFFIPGLVAAKILAPGLGELERLVVAAVASILISTQACYWLATAFGYSPLTLLAASGLICIAVIALDKKELGLPKLDGTERKALLAALLFFLLLFGIYANNIYAQRGDIIVVGGWNWSDLFIHLPIIRTINAGNFPPQMPFFAGAPMEYHYFSDLHTAIAAKAAALDVIWLIRFENALYAALFALACFVLAKRATGSNKAAALAVLLIVFGGSLAWTKLAADLQGAPLGQLLSQSGYDNDGGFFQIPSVLGGYLIVQRPQLVGLPALAAVGLLLLAFSEKRDRRLLFLAGILAALLAPFHYYAFATAFIVIGLFLAVDTLKNRRIDVEDAGHAMIPVVLALPFALPALLTTSGAGHVQFLFGWLAPKSPLDALVFYVMNFGLPVVLFIASLALAKYGHKLFLALWALACFAIPNVVSLSGTVWDMAKFFTYFWIPVGIGAAALLEKQHKAVIIAAVALSALTPVLILYWNAQSNWVAFGPDDVAAGNWIAASTPQNSVFVTTHTHLSPVDSIGGRLRAIGYLGWLNNFGFDYNARDAVVRQVYCGSPEEAHAAAIKLNASYVYYGPGERGDFACSRQPSQPFFTQAFQSGSITIFKVN